MVGSCEEENSRAPIALGMRSQDLGVAPPYVVVRIGNSLERSSGSMQVSAFASDALEVELARGCGA